MKINQIIKTKYSLFLFILLAFIYNIIVFKSKLSIVIMFIILLYLFNLYELPEKFNNDEFKNKQDIIYEHSQEFLDSQLDKIKDTNLYVDSLNIFPIYKNPNKFIFIKKDQYLQEIIHNLKFINSYDGGDYIKLIILIENFLKIYYNIIIDRYDKDYIDVLQDTRKEIINIMYNFKVDSPMYDNKGRYLHKIIDKNLIKLQSYTYKKMKNLNKKFPKYNPKNPKPIHKDDMKDYYQIFV